MDKTKIKEEIDGLREGALRMKADLEFFLSCQDQSLTPKFERQFAALLEKADRLEKFTN